MLFLVLALAFEVPPELPIWKISPEERIQRRFDPAGRQARVLAAREKRTASGMPPLPPDNQYQDVIHGQENPELFLPFEVFRRLTRMGFSSNVEAQQVFRELMEPARRDVGLPIDFWSRLDEITRSYRSQFDRKSAQPAMQDVETSEMDAEARSLCSARASALEAARREFGEEKFDRFLYLGVAPLMFSVTTGSGPSPDRLLELEKGCK